MIALIARAARFSPNSQERDAAILHAVAQALEHRRQPWLIWQEDDIPSTPPPLRAILSMARSRRAIERLVQWEEQGCCVLNSPSALLHCTRSRLDSWAQRAGSALPTLANTCDIEHIEQRLGYPLWLKRGDAAAQTDQEVQHIASRTSLRTALPLFADYADFTLSAHAEGQLLKFYGVVHTDFFHAAPPQYTKFGLERYNRSTASFEHQLPKLHKMADSVARESGLCIYGGDAIVRSDGSLALIDFNDWPSFSSCVSPAASAIVDALLLHL